MTSEKRSWGWSIPDDLLERKDLDMYEKVLITIMGRLGALEKPIYPRHQWLAERLGMSESGVRKVLARLQEKGIVKYEGRRWKIAMYSLTVLSGQSSPSYRSSDSLSYRDTHKKDIQSKDIHIKKNENSSFKKKKPFYKAEEGLLEMRWAQGKWFCLPAGGGQWLEFAGKEKDIIWQ